MKKILVLSFLTTVISFAVNAQTNVSGGIYNNTTWTKANSPYIVVDTVVVFPNVTLTIEPGVTVKFADSIVIEIRQGKLIAKGTSADSITFTSNSPSPIPGIYPGIYLNGGNLTFSFDYCNFSYANIGINAALPGHVFVNNSVFSQNITGLVGKSAAQNISIDSTVFDNNKSEGLHFEHISSITASNCIFSNNGTGLFMGDNFATTPDNFYALISFCNFMSNSNGILCNLLSSTISNCIFSLNTSYGLQVDDQQSSLDIFNNTIRNCFFDSNKIGLAPKHMLVDSCVIIYNQTGCKGMGYNRIINCTIDSNIVKGLSINGDSVGNCNIKYNGIGVAGGGAITGNIIEYNTIENIVGSGIIAGNTIRYSDIGIKDSTATSGPHVIKQNIIENNNFGIRLNTSNSIISCNTICNNTSYDLEYLASSNLNASHNYWCVDSTSLESLIYDGYDNINYGLVIFMPFDSLCSPSVTSVNEISHENLILIYPNPLTSSSILQLNSQLKNAEVVIYDMLGKEMVRKKMDGDRMEIEKGSLESGVYFVRVSTEEKQWVQKVVVE